MLVYVVDDDSALRTAYSTAIQQLGHEVETASDGLQAQGLVKNKKPNLIVLDMLMPNMDGLTFLKALRKDEDNNDIKVVVVSNFETMPEIEELGVSKYMSKLLHTPEAVSARVDSILKEKQS